MHTSPMTIFNDNVRAELASEALSIADLAEQIGMKREQLSKILNDRVDPSSSTLNRIAMGLNKPLWELFRPSEGTVTKHAEKVA